LKKKLLPIVVNQQQVVEASAVIAVLGDVESYNKAEKIYGQAVEKGYMPVMLIAIGNVMKPGHPTTRLPIEDVAFFNELPSI
jgi:nitroreductase